MRIQSLFERKGSQVKTEARAAKGEGGNRGNAPLDLSGGGIFPPWLTRIKNTLVRIG